jgi:hypothetical protein
MQCLSNPPTPANTTFVHPNLAYDGYLLDTDDVVYVYTTQPANEEMSLLLWTLGTNADFDLYASTTDSLPVVTSQYTSRQGGNRADLIVIPPSSTQRTIYIAIGSYSGSGQFRFYANAHAPGYPQTIYVVTDWLTSASHKSVIRNQLKKIQQVQYYATDGRHFIRDFEVHWNKPGSNQYPKPILVWTGFAAAGNKCYPGDHVTFDPGFNSFQSWCNGLCYPATDSSCVCTNTQSYNEFFATSAGAAPHEIGHCFYGLGTEEYWSQYGCGHSLMADRPNDFNMVDYCSTINGGTNPPSGRSSHDTYVDNWPIMEALHPSNPPFDTNYTPDPFWRTASQDDSDVPFSNYLTINEFQH